MWALRLLALLCACAVTVSEKGDMGRIEGNIGMGAALAEVIPFVQVALLFANGRCFTVEVGSATGLTLTGLTWLGE